MARRVLQDGGEVAPMTSALRMHLLPLFSAVILASPPAAGRNPRKLAAQRLEDSDKCLRIASRDEVLMGPLRSGSLGLGGKQIGAVRLSGARTFAEDALWDLVGGPPPLAPSREEVIALVARLARTGLFSAIEPRIVPADEVVELEIRLTENPRVRSVQVRGLSEFRTEDVLDRLLDAPTDREVERRRLELHEAKARECPAPLPPRRWLARLEDGEVRPGILWKGLRTALGRVLRMLSARGYPLAHLEGELTPAGDLLIDVDEGRVGAVEVRGVDPHIAREVEMELGIRRGDVFSSGELYSGLERVQRRWPFLRPDRGSRRSPFAPVLRLEERPGGGVEFHSEMPFDARPPPEDEDDDEPKPRRRTWDDLADDLMDEFPEFADDLEKSRVPKLRKLASRRAWYAFEGDTLIVYLRSDRSRAAAQWVEILRHTPVTGFAPGLATTFTIYDPGDRAHLMLDGAINYNTRRPSQDVAGGTYLERLNAKERVDWLLGPRLRVPALGIAELGGQVHTLTDTADRWRISAIDSYLYSMLFNRADREYYRRSGFAAFVTAHFFEELTLGIEYRRDRYAPLDVPGGVWSLFNSGDVRYGSAPVDEGEMGSAVFRLEYRSERVPLHRVGSMWRNSETSLVEAAEPWVVGLHTVNTVEVADRSLGGVFDFTRFVSDTFLALETGRSSSVTLRLRGAGGRDLPLQKQEGLGGWTALRGYDFKEFRGNASVLGTLQIEGRHFGVFLDVGTVRQPGTGWMDPKASTGALFCFANKSTCAEAAWRLDDRAKAAPDFRVLFSVPL